MNKMTGVLARILLAQIYLVSIVIQLGIILNNPEGYEAYRAYLGHFGLPGVFAPLMILIQLVAGAALFLGYKTRFAAYILAAYSLFVAFALKFNEPIIFMQYLAIAGGMLVLAINDKTALSLDSLLTKK